ncbi:dirigent protein 17-like [Coffea eugenioides]|uniref:dirigent protein 17-like n=1 Tax=Coffea eugenioides TaxID=49369 RepID=UPI000F608A1B|nr:dirigent protein 17-like [Coffea eugenioides]
MDNTCKVEELEMPVTGIFQLPGEPAIVINGLPPMGPRDSAPSTSNVVSDAKQHENPGFGEWLVGREVLKLFGGQYYAGKVAKYDEEMGWYRVVYEDGDSEDLEWNELEEVLRPLDIMVPLKSISAKIIRRQQKSVQKPAKLGTGNMLG